MQDVTSPAQPELTFDEGTTAKNKAGKERELLERSGKIASPKVPPNTGEKPVKIILFFNDNSFESYDAR